MFLSVLEWLILLVLGWSFQADSNKKGNPIEIIKNEGKFIIKNEYSKGYLKKTSQHLEGEEGSYENTYKYKKVKVPKSKVKRVEEQQKILILTGHFDLVY